MGGRVILPGLTDAHFHLQEYALSQQVVDCEVGSRQEILDRVAERARETPKGIGCAVMAGTRIPGVVSGRLPQNWMRYPRITRSI